MKKLFTVLFALMIATLPIESLAKTSSKSHGKKRSSSSAVTVKQLQTKTLGDFLTVGEFKCKTRRADYTVEYPLSGNPALVTALRNAIKDIMNGDFTGSLDTPDALIKSAVKRVESDAKEDLTIDITSNGDKSVVLHMSDEVMWRGAAHPMHANFVGNYRVSDGKKLTKSMLPAFSKLRPRILKGLADYFNVRPSELKDVLFEYDNLDYPESVYFDNNGLNVLYDFYEIGPYSLGTPHAVIPLDGELINLLSEEVKTYF